MPSQVWGRDHQEAFEEPYEYAIQDQFAREAGAVLTRLYRLLNSDRQRYKAQEQSREKAVWLLAMDALDSLRDSLKSLGKKEHRVAGKLFRDVVESMDLAAYFHDGSQKSTTSLLRWYANEVVPHREYREFVGKTQSREVAEQLAKHYASLSRFTHRSYHAILDGYSLGGGDRLVHDGTAEIYGTSEQTASMLVLPHTIARYYAVLANLVLEYSAELSELGLVSQEDIDATFVAALEPETAPRRFMPRRWLVDRLASTKPEKQSES